MLVGVLQAGLLAASYLSGTTRFGPLLRAMLAAALAASRYVPGRSSCRPMHRLSARARGLGEFPLRLAHRPHRYLDRASPPRPRAREDRAPHSRPRRPSSNPSTPSSLSARLFDSIEIGALKSGRAFAPLAKRISEGLGVLLPKVCASADATAISVPMLVTGVPPARHDEADSRAFRARPPRSCRLHDRMDLGAR